MDRDYIRSVSFSELATDHISYDDNSSSYEDEDDIEMVRASRQRKFDTRAAKRAKQGSKEPRRKDRGFTRTSKEDRQNRY